MKKENETEVIEQPDGWNLDDSTLNPYKVPELESEPVRKEIKK